MAMLLSSLGPIYADNQSSNAMDIWYRQPAEEWMMEALPIGNGRIGAMFFGGVARERIQFNEDTLWSGANCQEDELPALKEAIPQMRKLLAEGDIPGANTVQSNAGVFPRARFGAYQSFGDFYIEFAGQEGEVSNYCRSLDISRAVGNVTYQVGEVKYKREYFASRPDQVMVIRITADQPGQITARISKTTPHSKGQISVENSRDILLKGKMPDSGMQYASRLRVLIEGGNLKVDGNDIRVEKADAVVLLLAAKTNYVMNWPDYLGKDDPEIVTLRQVEAASEEKYDQLLKRHLEDYQALFGRVSLELPTSIDRAALPTDQRLIAYTLNHSEKKKNGGDPGLEAILFNFGRYLMIASSRTGTMPANLQGLWNASTKPAWDCDYHTDINIEMNYWLTGSTALPECFEPFSRYVDHLRKPGRETAKDYFGAEGFYVSIYSNPWGYAGPRWLWPGAAGWLSQNLYDHFLFTGDREYLRDLAYPFMKEACAFYSDLLVEYKDGTLAVAPSLSPEINFRYTDGKFYRHCAGSAIDQQIVYGLFEDTIEAAGIMEVDAELVDKLKVHLKHLSQPVKIRSNGEIQEWIEDWPPQDPQHRHLSHLYALYPGRMIHPDTTAAWVEAAEKTLDTRGKKGSTGWGAAWQIACWARLHKPEIAHDAFTQLIKRCRDSNISYSGGGGTYDNLLTCHSPFQIDSNFGFTAAVSEMLLQSHMGNWKNGYEIHLLPALPKAWLDGKVTGLRARGGFIIDLEWQDGKLTKAKVCSQLGRPCRIRYHKNIVDLSSRREHSYTLKMVKGQLCCETIN
ncbi:MAG: glycoside hydrolase family 95 protein [Anaerohalosphaera sp.]|nr:glycoside hydrolase family 95 protein [Anaerohalosphaera sp.]